MLNSSKSKSNVVTSCASLKSYDSSKLFMKIVIANLLVQTALQIVFMFFNPEIDYEEQAIYSIIIMYVIQIAFTMLYLKVRNKEKKQSKFKIFKKVKPMTYVFAMIAPIVLLLGFYLPTLVLEYAFTSIGYSVSSFILDTTLETVTAIIVIVLIAPIGEELVFRAIMLSGYYDGKKNVKSILKAVFIVGALFALSHMNPMQTFYQLFLGVLIGLLVILTGSVVIGIIVHVTSNLVAILIGSTPLNSMIYEAFYYLCEHVALMVLVIVIVLAVAIALITLIAKTVAKLEQFMGYESDESEGDASAKSEEIYSQQLIQQVYNRAGRLYLIIGICLSGLMWAVVFATSMGMF